MDTTPDRDRGVPAVQHETTEQEKSRLAWAVERIAEARADVTGGRMVNSAKVKASIDSIGTDHGARPVLLSRPLTRRPRAAGPALHRSACRPRSDHRLADAARVGTGGAGGGLAPLWSAIEQLREFPGLAALGRHPGVRELPCAGGYRALRRGRPRRRPQRNRRRRAGGVFGPASRAIGSEPPCADGSQDGMETCAVTPNVSAIWRRKAELSTDLQ